MIWRVVCCAMWSDWTTWPRIECLYARKATNYWPLSCYRLQLWQISVPAPAENRPFLQIRPQPKCSQISVLGRIWKMAHTNTAMFNISTSFKKLRSRVAIFSICLFSLLRSHHHLVTDKFLFPSLWGIRQADFIYASSLSSFMNKSQIQSWLRPDMSRQINGFTKPESGTALHTASSWMHVVPNNFTFQSAADHPWMHPVTQRRSIANSVGCFQWRLFVCLCVCPQDNFRKSKHRMMKLGGRCTVQKSRPSSNLWVIAPLGAHPQKCGIRLRRWENQHKPSSYVIWPLWLLWPQPWPNDLGTRLYLHMLIGIRIPKTNFQGQSIQQLECKQDTLTRFSLLRPSSSVDDLDMWTWRRY